MRMSPLSFCRAVFLLSLSQTICFFVCTVVDTTRNVQIVQALEEIPLTKFQGEDLCSKIDNDLLPDPDTSVFPNSSQALVGAYYYPWHLDDFHGGQGYLRENISQCPLLGEYDDSDPKTIAHHLAWSRQANIRLWAMSWWGPEHRADSTIRNTILKHKDLGTDMKLAIFYETTGRVKKVEDDRRRRTNEGEEEEEEMTLSERVREARWMAYENSTATETKHHTSYLRETGREEGHRRHLKDEINGYSIENIKTDMEYICKNFADHDNYLRIDDRPVLFIYLTRKFFREGVLEAMMDEIRSTKNCDFYIVGDHAFQIAPTTSEGQGFELLDSITNYDVYGSFGAGQIGALTTEQVIIDHYKNQQQWKNLAIEKNVGYIPSISPGYNDMGVRPQFTRPPLARVMLGKPTEGSLFAFSLEQAKPLLDPDVSNILMVTSFNEWHEDTQIEPVAGLSPVDEPQELTFGVPYQAYGDAYLKILRAGTSKDNENGIDLAVPDVDVDADTDDEDEDDDAGGGEVPWWLQSDDLR
jgi:Glycosyl hydrolase family 99